MSLATKYRVSLAPYTLKNQQSHQMGFLLRTVSTDTGQLGYSAVQPHANFGDPSCDELKQSLRSRKPHPILLRAIELAALEWVEAKLSLAKCLAEARLDFTANSNFLIQHLTENIQMSILEAKNLHFGTLKIKAKNLDEILTQALRASKAQNFKVRLDGNEQWAPEEALSYFQNLENELVEVIEYVEDPMPAKIENLASWQKLNAITPLALDNCADPSIAKKFLEASAFRHWILKPSRMDKARLKYATQSLLPITVTSSLDHPIGIIHAFHFLARYRKNHWNEAHGLNTFTNFTPTPYDHVFEYSSSKIQLHKDSFKIAESLLENESWQDVCEFTL